MIYPDLIDLPLEVFGGYCPAIPPSDLSPGAASIAQDVAFPQGAVRTRGGLANIFSAGAGGILGFGADGFGVSFGGISLPAGSVIPGNPCINGLRSYITPTLAQRLMVWTSLGSLFAENPQGTLNLINSRSYQNLFYRSDTVFGREYQAFFNSLGGFDIPRQFDDTNWDRVSQVGPGAAPLAVDENIVVNTLAAPNGLLQAGQSLVASPNGLIELGNVVTLVVTGTISFLQVGDLITIAGAGVGAYNATWAVSKIVNSTTLQFIANVTGLAPSGGGTLSSNIADVIPATAYVPTVGQLVTIAGAGVAGYNGTWVVRRVNTPPTSFQVATASTGLGASGTATITAAGNIVTGRHQVSLCFITRQGFITQAAVPNTWLSAGSKRVVCSQIATGPPNVIARLLLFTPVITAPALTGSFYSLPNGSTQIGVSATMLIPDNTTTSVTVDFTDTILIAGFQANYLFTQLELGESASTIGYNSRLVWLGERNKQQNFVNLTFDGGFGTDTSGRKFPYGWSQDAANYGGGGSANAQGLAPDWGDAYAITGDGATAIRGKIAQSAFQDYLQAPIIGKATAYSVRVRVAKAGGLLTGTLHINLNSVSTFGTTVGLSITPSQLNANYTEFIATLTDVPLATPPSDLLLQVYVDGTPNNGGVFLVDSIEPFATNTPFNYSTARISHAFNPESYDGTTGQIQVRPGDGQQLRCSFPLRNNLYLAKDHYLCYVADDGVNEPSSWAVNEVSGTVGICGPNAVDWTEEWAVFAERSGLYICWGSDPVKITPEIQSDASAGYPLYGQGGYGGGYYGGRRISWADINWAAAHTIWVRIDKVNKLILVGAPVSGALTPTVVFMMDFRWLETAQDIAAGNMVTYSAFTGKMLSHGKGRRWAVWNIQANSMTFAERADGTAAPFYGNGAGNGKIYQQLDPWIQASDDGNAINSIYQTYGAPSHMEEQQFQLGSHRKLFGYLKFRATGAGSLLLALSTTLRTTLLRSYTLSMSPAGDGERPVNIHGERFYITIRTNAVGQWFQLEKLIPSMKKDATIVVRGVSA